MAHAKKSRMSRLQSDKTYNKKSSLTFSTHTKIAIPTMTDIEISHIEHTSRVNEWQAGQEVGKKQASKDESEAKKCCLCRFIRCILCSWILIIIAGGIAAIVAWQLGAFETDAYAFTDSSTNSELCNGLASNCDWKVNEIMFPGVHNAMSSKANGFVGWNNLLPLEAALDAGFRALFLDSCECAVIGAALCHSACAAGYRTIIPVFTGIMDFMNKNPNEVVIIELQVGGNTLIELFEQVLTIPGFSDIMYEHPGREDEWPLMKDLITSNKRLIVFQHDGGGCDKGECPKGVHDTYVHAFETPFDSIGVGGLLNVTSTCQITRGDYRNAFFISNHYGGDERGLPDFNVASEVNLAENLEIRLDACQEMVGRRVNVLVVDFWDVGNVLEVVTKYNTALGFATSMPSSAPSGEPRVSPSTTAPVLSVVPKSASPTLPSMETMSPFGQLFAPTTAAPSPATP